MIKQVFLAEHRETKQKVAVKVYKKAQLNQVAKEKVFIYFFFFKLFYNFI